MTNLFVARLNHSSTSSAGSKSRLRLVRCQLWPLFSHSLEIFAAAVILI